MSAALPDKLYFKIGEVSRLAQVKPYILRYWETEFPQVRPTKARSQHRLYRRRDVETILRIKKLLYEEGYTIEGARRHLRGETDADPSADVRVRSALKRIKKGLEDLRKLLE